MKSSVVLVVRPASRFLAWALDSPHDSSKTLRAHPLAVGLIVSSLAAAIGRWAPAEHAASLVGLGFLGATYWLCMRGDRAADYGLALGGLAEDGRLDFARLCRETLWALLWALGLAALVLPPFTLAFIHWYEPTLGFSWERAQVHLAEAPYDLVLGHLLVVALPEEAFFRGYLQSSLDQRWGTPFRLMGARIGSALWVSSALFAVGHLAALPHPARLAVFFPSLAFGWLRARTGGVGAPIWFHALCNVYSAVLAAGFGFSSQ